LGIYFHLFGDFTAGKHTEKAIQAPLQILIVSESQVSVKTVAIVWGLESLNMMINEAWGVLFFLSLYVNSKRFTFSTVFRKWITSFWANWLTILLTILQDVNKTGPEVLPV